MATVNKLLVTLAKKPSLVKSLSNKTLDASLASERGDKIFGHGGLSEIPPQNNPSAHQIGRCANQHLTQGNMPNDDFAAVLLWAQGNKMYCREITAHPEPLLIRSATHRSLQICCGGPCSTDYN